MQFLQRTVLRFIDHLQFPQIYHIGKHSVRYKCNGVRREISVKIRNAISKTIKHYIRFHFSWV